MIYFETKFIHTLNLTADEALILSFFIDQYFYFKYTEKLLKIKNNENKVKEYFYVDYKWMEENMKVSKYKFESIVKKLLKMNVIERIKYGKNHRYYYYINFLTIRNKTGLSKSYFEIINKTIIGLYKQLNVNRKVKEFDDIVPNENFDNENNTKQSEQHIDNQVDNQEQTEKYKSENYQRKTAKTLINRKKQVMELENKLLKDGYIKIYENQNFKVYGKKGKKQGTINVNDIKIVSYKYDYSNAEKILNKIEYTEVENYMYFTEAELMYIKTKPLEEKLPSDIKFKVDLQNAMRKIFKIFREKKNIDVEKYNAMKILWLKAFWYLFDKQGLQPEMIRQIVKAGLDNPYWNKYITDFIELLNILPKQKQTLYSYLSGYVA